MQYIVSYKGTNFGPELRKNGFTANLIYVDVEDIGIVASL